MNVDCYGLTDAGKKRPINEDQFLIADLEKAMLIQRTSLPQENHSRLIGGSQGKLLVVADGVGGRGNGDFASMVAVDTTVKYVLNMMPWLLGLDERTDDDLKDELRSAVKKCQSEVFRAAPVVGRAVDRMSTTLTMAFLLWPRLYVVHVGDSRCYLCRSGKLEQITRDHTYAQQMVEKGALGPEEAEGSRWSCVLWNVVGGSTPDLAPKSTRPDSKKEIRCFCVPTVSLRRCRTTRSLLS